MKQILTATRLQRENPFSGIYTIHSVCRRPIDNLGQKKWNKVVSKQELEPLNTIWKGIDVPEQLILPKIDCCIFIISHQRLYAEHTKIHVEMYPHMIP